MTKKVLIVEDEAGLRQALATKLRFEKLEVFEAGDGEEGLQTALENHPDLILLDLVMPKMDGETMLKRLVADSWGKTAKVIILTNFGENTRVAGVTLLGNYDYLVKSDWDLNEVIKRVKDKLKV